MTDTMRPLPVDCSALLHGEPRLTTSSRLRLYLPLTPLAFTSTQSGKLHPCMTRIDRSRLVLWSQSSQVIQSYGSPSAAYGLMFLGAHFVWAFSLMFLFSGRGYWQAIIWAHKVVVAAHVLVGFQPTCELDCIRPSMAYPPAGRVLGLGIRQLLTPPTYLLIWDTSSGSGFSSGNMSALLPFSLDSR